MDLPHRLAVYGATTSCRSYDALRLQFRSRLQGTEMNLTEQLPYKSISTAKRAAKSMGFETFNIVQRGGQWFIDLTPTPADEIANAKPVTPDTSEEPTIPVKTSKSRKTVATASKAEPTVKTKPMNKPAPKRAAKASKTKANSKPATKGETKRVPKRQHSSLVASPVARVWVWLATGKNAELKRSEVIAELVKLGVHGGTASVQRQKFLNASTAERKARVERYKD